jgi:aminoglycoside 6'-N-acetyltransferase I
MAEIAIRPLSLADRVAWAGLRHALWPHATVGELGEKLEREMAAGFAGFGAFDGAMLVGFAEVSERPVGDGCDTAPVAWLEGIYVAPGQRRLGLGKRLLEAAIAWARGRGLGEMGSDAEIDNLVSRLSHARWGFEETERVVRFRRLLG